VADESCRISSFQGVFYLETFTEEALKGRAHHEKICNALLVALMCLLLRELESSPALLAMPAIQNELQLSSERNPNVIEQSKEYIRGHIGEALTLNKVARHAYMSERSFSHQFRQATGQSFMEYLTDCRYKEAVKLLKSTDWSVEMIAGFVGVKGGRLRALFHQRVGVSPTEYRQSNKIAGI
jgi:AraC-like DNA-binding protein